MNKAGVIKSNVFSEDIFFGGGEVLVSSPPPLLGLRPFSSASGVHLRIWKSLSILQNSDRVAPCPRQHCSYPSPRGCPCALHGGVAVEREGRTQLKSRLFPLQGTQRLYFSVFSHVHAADIGLRGLREVISTGTLPTAQRPAPSRRVPLHSCSEVVGC